MTTESTELLERVLRKERQSPRFKLNSLHGRFDLFMQGLTRVNKKILVGALKYFIYFSKHSEKSFQTRISDRYNACASIPTIVIPFRVLSISSHRASSNSAAG